VQLRCFLYNSRVLPWPKHSNSLEVGVSHGSNCERNPMSFGRDLQTFRRYIFLPTLQYKRKTSERRAGMEILRLIYNKIYGITSENGDLILDHFQFSIYGFSFFTSFFRSWRKLTNKELHNLYSSPSIVTIFK
jgi:hypothetical protein